MKEAAFGEILRIIKEEEPPKPSTRLSDSGEALASISANRHTEPAKLTKLVKGELDWIVMKCLEKDRNRRYETANGFAMDVQRYLADEPVQVCPPSAGYRLRKFARRNKGALVTVAVVALALVVGTVISTWQAVRATEAEGLAQERFEAEKKALEQTEEARKEAVANLQQAREAVDQMLTRVGAEGGLFADEPGLTPVRRALLEDAFKFYQRFLQQNSTDPVIRAETGLAAARVGEISVYLSGDRARADEAFAQSIKLLTQARVDFPTNPKYPHELGRCYNRLAEALTAAGRLEEAEQEHRRALLQFEAEGQLQLTPHQERGRRQELAYTYLNLGKALAPAKPKDAEQAFRQVLDLAAKLDADFPNDLIYQRYLAFGSRNLAELLRAKQPENALPLYKRSAELLKKLSVQFPDHPLGRGLANTAGLTYSSLGTLLTRLERADEARAAHLEAVGVYQQSAAQYEKLSPQVHQGKTDYGLSAAREYANLAMGLSRLDRWKEAITAGRKAVELKPNEAQLNNTLAWILATCPDAGLRDPEQAVFRAKRAVELAPKSGDYRTILGMAHYRAGEWKAAITALEKSMEMRRGGNSFDWFFLAMAHWQLGEKDKARKWYVLAVQLMEKNESKNEDLRRFRVEASELMGLKEKK
jgi:tetratricopeptide (TPR) repeat protein